MTNYLESTPKERGQRLREVRRLANLTLKEMSNDGTINFHTLGGWESGKHGGLTEKGAIQVVERLAQANVQCTSAWLLYNVGEPPGLLHPMESYIQQPIVTSLKDFLPQQIKHFEQLYPDFLGLVIQDDAMSPVYRYGDYVSGMPMLNEQLRLAAGKNIIARLETGRLLCRTVLVDPLTRVVSLVAANPACNDSLLHNVNIVAWALVLCHFRNEQL